MNELAIQFDYMSQRTIFNICSTAGQVVGWILPSKFDIMKRRGVYAVQDFVFNKAPVHIGIHFKVYRTQSGQAKLPGDL